MDLTIDIVEVVVGGAILYVAAEWLVKGSAGLARAFGVRPLVIGLTVVAYGTSAPELAVSAAAAVGGSSPIVLGNIIGSCVANIGLILGITALIAPPSVDGRMIKREVPILLVSSLSLPLVLAWDSSIVLWEAIVLLSCAIGFTVLTLSAAKRGRSEDLVAPETEEEEAGEAETSESKVKLGMLTAVGLAALLAAGQLFVDGAKGLAMAIGMSERVVGLTVVAIGTSLPELAASVVAALRGFSGLAVGNVVGSNIFNVFLVLGGVGLIKPIDGALSTMRLDLAFMLGLTFLAVLAMRGSRRISRPEGILLLGTYVTFIVIALVTG